MDNAIAFAKDLAFAQVRATLARVSRQAAQCVSSMKAGFKDVATNSEQTLVPAFSLHPVASSSRMMREFFSTLETPVVRSPLHDTDTPMIPFPISHRSRTFSSGVATDACGTQLDHGVFAVCHDTFMVYFSSVCNDV